MAENGVTNPVASNTEESLVENKGKGKAAEDTLPTEDTAMDEDDSDSDEEEEAVEPEEDGLEEIDLNNIVEGGRRTRGTQIDFAKAAEENPADDYDEDEDEDFQPPDEDTKMSD